MNFEVQLLKKSILIVDDDEALSESIKEVLASRGFQNIHVAYSISEELGRCEEVRAIAARLGHRYKHLENLLKTIDR